MLLCYPAAMFGPTSLSSYLCTLCASSPMQRSRRNNHSYRPAHAPMRHFQQWISIFRCGLRCCLMLRPLLRSPHCRPRRRLWPTPMTGRPTYQVSSMTRRLPISISNILKEEGMITSNVNRHHSHRRLRQATRVRRNNNSHHRFRRPLVSAARNAAVPSSRRKADQAKRAPQHGVLFLNDHLWPAYRHFKRPDTSRAPGHPHLHCPGAVPFRPACPNPCLGWVSWRMVPMIAI